MQIMTHMRAVGQLMMKRWILGYHLRIELGIRAILYQTFKTAGISSFAIKTGDNPLSSNNDSEKDLFFLSHTKLLL